MSEASLPTIHNTQYPPPHRSCVFDTHATSFSLASQAHMKQQSTVPTPDSGRGSTAGTCMKIKCRHDVSPSELSSILVLHALLLEPYPSYCAMLLPYIARSRNHITQSVTLISKNISILSNTYPSSTRMAPMSYSSALTGKKDSDHSSPGQNESSTAQAANNIPPQQTSGGRAENTRPQPQPPRQKQHHDPQRSPNQPPRQQHQQNSPLSHPRQSQQQSRNGQSHQPNSGAYTKEQYVRRAEQTPHTSNEHETRRTTSSP